jgi:YidC/Oxa1 family membrane protein insertase
MMKLYKVEGVNPLGGCLPMVIQMPILFSLFNVFRGAIELRQSEFVFWITDLSQPDRFFIGGFEIHLLPLLMAVSTFFQSKMTMKDPKQAIMVYMMPVFMTWIFWSMSSGLVLYWTMFNGLTILQQQVMERVKRVLDSH